MRIYRMTATFGNLEHRTLELEPGLNVITAPNEWGKSTWCAFLVAMLYGLDTRAKTTRNSLADKERYAPWTGSPMAGRIDLNWKGKDITIERSTRRRIPLGEFRAYETASGLDVPELSAGNCGQMLLGVEQGVFRRAGFIRHTDLPVTQDEALRRRLNALVTTGDDSGIGDRLTADLRDLRNRCRYNRTGLLPQAEARKLELEGKLSELASLDVQTNRVQSQLEEIRSWLGQLYNHQQALSYSKMEADIRRVEQARSSLEQLERELSELETACQALPPQEETEAKVRELRAFREQWNAMQMEIHTAPLRPQLPAMPEPFQALTLEEAKVTVSREADLYRELTKTKLPGVLMVMGLLGLAAGASLCFLRAYWFAAVAGITGLASLVWGIYERISLKKKTKGLVKKYGSADWSHWADPLAGHEERLRDFRNAMKEYKDVVGDLEVRMMVLRKKGDQLCGEENMDAVQERWEQAWEKWEACLNARREAAGARTHYENLSAMLRPVEKPTMEDRLTQSPEETEQLLADCALEQQRLQNRLGQYQGRREILGDRENLQRQLEQTKLRIAHLEDMYDALSIAQETLSEARAELQRRFAPRITKRAQQLLAQMTGGRYHSLTMRDDFSLQAGAGQEETLSDAIWRSDGTMDQLYLSLRLAVAEELTPEAPLILDDALVRFDDERMTAAVKILKEMARQKQVILFTCQGREAAIP